MARIWVSVAAAAALVLVLGAVAVHAVSGLDLDAGDQPMMDNWASGNDAGAGRVAGESEYLTQMVAHHEEALEAAEQLARSDRPRLRELGASIVRIQSAQVMKMNTWLTDWYPDPPASRPGYEPEMRDLTGRSGDQLDRVFLIDMIGHHMLAVLQSQHLMARGLVEHEEVGVLARTIRDEQREEISQMVRWLRQWYPGTRPRIPATPSWMMRGSMGPRGSGYGPR
jgi:uncharacterized protein (DUF305 family)